MHVVRCVDRSSGLFHVKVTPCTLHLHLTAWQEMSKSALLLELLYGA